MNSTSIKFGIIRFSSLFILLTSSSQLTAITSNMTPRVISTSPLFYKMIDYSKRQTSFEVEPMFSAMYDSQHTISNLTPSGKQTLIFDQQGNGDVNPMWMNLMSNNLLADYFSTVTFTPKLTQSGMLFHFYDQFETTFIDIKTALVQCKSQIEVTEIGGGNGLNSGVLNAQQAFTQSSWNYGKIGESNHVVGLDNVELRFGKVSQAASDSSSYELLLSSFGIIEAPTGSGTKAEWLFEPQVGTNHWGLGFGFEALVSGDDDLKFMIAANYRYLTPAWETRSFDLLGNGAWSRYLSVQDTYGLPTAPATDGLPGINYFTQQAYIAGRSQINIYSRLAKQLRNNYFELSYNFFCIQQESIGTIRNINSNYGIYALTGPAGGSGGVTTSNSATINQDVTTLDPIGNPITITTDRFDKLSAAAGTYVTNKLTARMEIPKDNIVYGFGASIEAAQSASAISSWAVWGKFEYLFDTMLSPDNYSNEFASELYDFDSTTQNITHHRIDITENGLPEEVISAIEDDFIDDLDSFEFLEDEEFNFNENEIHALNNDLNLLEDEITDNQMDYTLEQANNILAAAQTIEIEPFDMDEENPTSINLAMEEPAEHVEEIEETGINITPTNETISISTQDLRHEEQQAQPTIEITEPENNVPVKATENKAETISVEIAPEEQTPAENPLQQALEIKTEPVGESTTKVISAEEDTIPVEEPAQVSTEQVQPVEIKSETPPADKQNEITPAQSAPVEAVIEVPLEQAQPIIETTPETSSIEQQAQASPTEEKPVEVVAKKMSDEDIAALLNQTKQPDVPASETVEKEITPQATENKEPSTDEAIVAKIKADETANKVEVKNPTLSEADLLKMLDSTK